MTLEKEQGLRNAITFGVQGVQSSYSEALASIWRMGRTPVSMEKDEVTHDAITQFGETIHQTTLFRLLGFEKTESIDYYPDEKPTYLADLNYPIDEKLKGKYSLVYDGGTMEHCFNPAQVMLNASLLVDLGGTVIHHVPMNNWVDHGFYQFSPTLFFDFYSTNKFSDLNMKVHFMGRHKESYINYNPRIDEPLPYALGGTTRMMLFFSARKSTEFTDFKFPVQGRYRELFGNEGDGPPKPKAGVAKRLQMSFRKRMIRFRSVSL